MCFIFSVRLRHTSVIIGVPVELLSQVLFGLMISHTRETGKGANDAVARTCRKNVIYAIDSISNKYGLRQCVCAYFIIAQLVLTPNNESHGNKRNLKVRIPFLLFTVTASRITDADGERDDCGRA